MFSDKFVFAQLVAFLAIMFVQLANRESLRNLIVALDAHRSKCYHLEMGKNISKSSLARANQDRDYHIFEEYTFYLVSEARKRCCNNIFELGGNVYAFDSTTINLCLEMFWWAKFRKKKGCIKVHTLYDVETQIATFFHITTASTYDSKAMSKIPYETGLTIYLTILTTSFHNCLA